MTESNPSSDSRDAHILSCLTRTALAGGMVVTDPVPGSFSVGVVSSPAIPPAASLAEFDAVLCASADVAERIGPKARPLAPPIDGSLLKGQRSAAHWLDWNSADYRVYTCLSRPEIGRVYPLVTRFLREYRFADPVSLTIRYTGERDDVVQAVSQARQESNVPEAVQARLRLHCGPWQAWEQALLAVWGDCCVLPWCGADLPVELGYALAAGNFVAATRWSAGGLPRGVGIPIDYRADAGEFGPHAVVDWEQVQSVIRVAVANGRREHDPARRLGESLFCENPNFWPKLMSKLGAPADFYDRGTLCRSSSQALTFAVLGRSSEVSRVTFRRS